MPNVQLTVDVLTRNQQGLDQVSNRLRDIEQRSNQARRETLQYRDAIAELNREFARNASTLQHADGIAREQLQTRQRQIRAEQGLLRARREQSALTLATLTQERRELGALSGASLGAARSTNIFRDAVGGLVAGFGELALDRAIHELAQFARGSVDAAIRMDTARRALTTLTGSAEEAEMQLEELQRLADFPGLTFRQALQGVTALRAIDESAERTTRILREFANAAAFSGDAGGLERALLGLRQLIQRAKLSQEELSQLTENIGLVSRAIKEEFGTVIAEDIQEQLDASGQTIDDFVNRLLAALERLDRFPIDATATKLGVLSNSFFEFQASVGDNLLPAVDASADLLTRLLDSLTDTVDNLNEIDFSVLGGIFGFLTGGVAGANLGGQAVGALGGGEEVEAVERSISELNTELQALGTTLTENQRRYDAYVAGGSDPASASMQSLSRIIENQKAQMSALSEELTTATAGMTDLFQPTEDITTSFRILTQETENVDTRFLAFHERGQALQETIRELPPEIAAVRMEFDVLAPTAARVAEVFRNVQTAVVDTAEEQRALNLVNSELHGGLLPTAEALQLTAHNAALVNPEISQAADSMREFVEVMDNVQTEFMTVEEISDRVRESLRGQSEAWDELRRSTGAAEVSIRDALDALDISSEVDLLPPIETLEDFLEQLPDRLERGGIGQVFSDLITNTELLGDIAIRSFDVYAQAARESTQETIENIRNLNAEIESLSLSTEEVVGSFSDLGARIATGDLTAALQLPGRVAEINRQTDEAFRIRRQQRRDESIDERTVAGARDRNLATAARVLGIDFGRFDISEAPHFADQGPISLNDFSASALDILSRNLMAGVSDIAGGIEAGIQQALDATDIEEPIARGLLTLIANLEEDLTAIDIAAIFQPGIAALEERVADVAASLTFAELTDDDAAFQDALQESITANREYYQRRIEAANLQMRLFGESIENADELNRALQAMNNAIRLQLEPVEFNVQQGIARVEEARRTAERLGTDRQFTEDIARQQYGAAAYDAEVAAAEAATTSAIAAREAAAAAAAAAEADASMAAARSAAEAARTEIEEAAAEARRIADSEELFLRDQFGNRTDVRGDIILPEHVQEERRRTAAGATSSIERILRERQEQIAREREAEAEAFDFEAVLEGFLSASEESTEQLNVHFDNLMSPLDGINTGVSDTVAAVREVAARMSPLENISTGISEVVAAVNALAGNINLQVANINAQTGFHSVIADSMAYRAGVEAQEALLYGGRATTTQEQQYAHQSAADFSQNFGRGFSSGRGGGGGTTVQLVLDGRVLGEVMVENQDFMSGVSDRQVSLLNDGIILGQT